jgi:hypothetical protein
MPLPGAFSLQWDKVHKSACLKGHAQRHARRLSLLAVAGDWQELPHRMR